VNSRVLVLLLWFWLACPAQALDPSRVLGRAIAMGHGPAVETFVAKYQPDLNLPVPLTPTLSLRPLSIALSRIQAQQQRQLLAHVEQLGYLPELEPVMVERLLRLDAHPVYQEPDLDLHTPLHLVFGLPFEQQAELLRLLMTYQAWGNLSLTDRQGLTPAEFAADQHAELAKWLADYKPSGLSDFNIRYKPFAYAKGQRALERFEREEALLDAIAQGDLAEIEQLLLRFQAARQRPDYYLLQPVGQPLLHQVATQGQTPVLLLLLKYGADLQMPDFQRRQVLHLLAATAHTERISLLLQAGARVNAREASGETPLFYAIRAAQAQNIRVLLQAGADAQLPNHQGQTAKMLLRSLAQAHGEPYASLLPLLP